MENLIDKTFGELKVVGEIYDNLYQCKCKCGNLKIVSKFDLENLITTDCGHIEKENNRLKRIYQNMKNRCYNDKSISYKYYGKKGVKICKEWLSSFDIFYNWAINNGYSKELTLDRIDNNKNYSPDNCRWSTVVEQNNNRSSCHYINYNNITLTLSQWAKKCNISPGNLLHKINKEGEKTALKSLLENKNV